MRLIRGALIVNPVDVTLCTTEAQYKKQVRKMKVDAPGDWLLHGAGATTHFLEAPNGEVSAVVCVTHKGHALTEIHAMLVHEAMHIWREVKKSLNEKEPSEEFECYAIQGLSLDLFVRFAELKGKK